MITSSQQPGPQLLSSGPFGRTGIPVGGMPGSAITASPGNNNVGNAELTGDSLWDSLYNTTIRTLSLDGLELLAKSFDNLDPNHQLYAGIAKRQRKLMEYQGEFRRNLEVFCQRANLNPKVWPSCIRHVKPSPRKDSASHSANTSGLDLLGGWSSASKPSTKPTGEAEPSTATPCEKTTTSEPATASTSLSTPMTPLPNSCESSATEQKDSNEKPKCDDEKPEEKEPVDQLSSDMASASIEDRDNETTKITHESPEPTPKSETENGPNAESSPQ